jgi:hypothetical protein
MPARCALVLAFAILAAACGSKIGDSCAVGSDCSQEGGRICDRSQPDGYCTVANCDVGTCPEESECVQFFASVRDTTCATAADCSLDQVCTVGGYCADRATESRFCMLRCGSQGDCRDGYECRNLERMGQHGGQPVAREGQEVSELPFFCSASLPCTADTDCDLNDKCDLGNNRCQPR